MSHRTQALCLLALSLVGPGCRRERGGEQPSDARACTEGSKPACLRRIDALNEEIGRSREQRPSARTMDLLAERGRFANRLCELGDCLPQFRFALGDGSGSAEQLWRRLCDNDRKRVLTEERIPESADAGDTDPWNPSDASIHRSCETLATLASETSSSRQRCIAGSAPDCISWSDAVVAEDEPRAAVEALPEEYERRELQAVLTFGSFVELGLKRGRERGKSWIEQVHSAAGLRVALGHDPLPGECLPGFGGCRPTPKEEVERLRSSARVRTVSAKSSDEARLPPATLLAALDRAHEPLLECHRRALFANPNSQGTMSVRATLDATGHAWSATFTANLYAPGIPYCVLEVIRSWRFTPAAGGAVVTVDLAFEPQQAKGGRAGHRR